MNFVGYGWIACTPPRVIAPSKSQKDLLESLNDPRVPRGVVGLVVSRTRSRRQLYADSCGKWKSFDHPLNRYGERVRRIAKSSPAPKGGTRPHHRQIVLMSCAT
jgi:hypothetical protein